MRSKFNIFAMSGVLLFGLLIFNPIIRSSEAEDLPLYLISSPFPEYGLVFSPDGKTAIFARMSNHWGVRGNTSMLYILERSGNNWSEPRKLLDDGFSNSAPFFAPDGETLYFTTNRTSDGAVKNDDDIWMADFVIGELQNLRSVPNVNSEHMERSPVFTSPGHLFFASDRDGGFGQGDIWVSSFENGKFSKPKSVGHQVNTATGEWNIFVPDDESYLILEASGREGAESQSGDLYLHRRQNDGWSFARPLNNINTEGSDLMPRLSPSGEYFYYTSSGAFRAKDTEIKRAKASDFLIAESTKENITLLVASRSNHEIVALDPDTLKILARYPTGGPGPHEVAVTDDQMIAFAPNYGVFPEPHEGPILPSEMQFESAPSDTLARIDINNGPTLSKTFKICSRSHGVAISPDNHVWVTCGNEAKILELDGENGTVIKEWVTGDIGSHIVVATRNNRYVVTSNVESASVSIIDRRDEKVTTIKTGAGAEGLVLTPDHSRVWVGNTQENTISIINIAEGKIVEEFSSEGRFPVKTVITPDLDEAWVVNTFSHEIAIFDAVDYSLRQKLSFDTPPLGIQISPDGNHIYVTFPRLNEVRSFERESRREVARVSGIIEADGMAWARLSDMP